MPEPAILQPELNELGSVLNLLPAMVMVVGPDQRIRFCNEAAAELFDVDGAEVIGESVVSVFKPSAFSTSIRFIDSALLGERRTHEVELERDGERKTIISDYVPIIELGQVRGIVIHSRDITDQRSYEKILIEQQNLLKNLTDVMPSFISYVDSNLRYRFVNSKYETFFKKSLSEIHGRHIKEIIGEANFIPRYPYFLRALRGESIRFEIKISSPSGELRDFETQYIPDFDYLGQVQGLVICANDVTEFRAATQRALDAARARDEFISVASHELKTPLTSLRLQEQVIKRRLLNDNKSVGVDKIIRTLENSERQTDRLIHLVDDMLDMSRMLHNKLQLIIEPVDLSQVMNDCIERLSYVIESSGSDLTPDIEPSVIGQFDGYRIEQIFTNLITNAIKYGCQKPIAVRLKKVGDQAVVNVSDQGQGIAKSDQERIFLRFERASSSVGGLGMGLYIARELARTHGGDITVESQPGIGSSFTVTLPLVSQVAQKSQT